MIKKVCFLVNYNQYESKRYFTEKFAEAMERHGVKTKTLDVQETKIHERVIDDIKAYGPDFTASFNSFLPFPDNTYLWDLTKIPHLSMLLDPSLYSVHLIDSPYSIISCVDQFDCFGLTTQNFARVLFFPHAIEKELFDFPEEEKEYDVVFIGSCYDYETMHSGWKREFSAPICSALEAASDIVLSDVQVPLQEALVRGWRMTDLPAQGVDFLKLFTYVDKYSRGLDRVQLIRSIKEAPVHIFGELFEDDPSATKGWKDLLKDCDNVTFHDPVNYNESLEVLRKSKICLNSSPFFKGGAHERIFSGLASGALVITNENVYMRDAFEEGKEIVFYRPKEWDEVNKKIHHYLQNESERKKIVDAGREKVRSEHTWDERAKLLKQVMPEMIKQCESCINSG